MPSWGLIDELQKNNVEVIGTDSNPLSFGLHLLKKGYVVPEASNPDYIKKMLAIIDEEQPDAILSGPEEELLALSKNKKKIEKKGVVLLTPDYGYVKICADKVKTDWGFKYCRVETPKIFYDDEPSFPCIIKPRFGRGSKDVYLAKDEEELQFYLKNVKAPIVQEFIRGVEYSVDILADRSFNAVSVVPRIRIAIESGKSVKSTTVYDKEIIEKCKKITRELELFGPSCIQCIRNENGLYFIEINTRFGGGSILSIKADPTIIKNLLRIIRGEDPIPSKTFTAGLTMLRYYSEVFK